MTAIALDDLQDAIRRVTPEEVESFRRNGWAKLDQILSPELVDRLLTIAQAEMGKEADRDGYLDNNGRGARYSYWSDAAFENDWLRGFSQSREMAAVPTAVRDGRSMRWYTDTFLAKRPASAGGAMSPWHQDLPMHAFDRVGATTMWIPLVDCPPEKGAVRFLNGSRATGPLGRFGTRADGLPRDTDIADVYPEVLEQYEMGPALHLKVGDATIHDFLTVHSAPPNTTETTRWAYTITWFPTDALYTGTRCYITDGLGLTIDEPFELDRFPVVS